MLMTLQRCTIILSLTIAVTGAATGALAPASASAATRADFNGDGFHDLAVGVPGEAWGVQSGGVNVIYGSPGGLSATATPDQYFDQDSLGIDGTAEGSDYFGRSLATGDFNADGYSDLIVGVPFEDEGATDSGAINVIYGSAAGLSAFATADQYLHPNSPNVEGVAENGDLFGVSLAAADFNDDGYSDAAIGVTGEDTGPTDDGGVNVIYGSSSGLSATTIPDQYLGQDSVGVDGVAETGDQYGTSLATADFDNDGYADVAIGVPLEDEGASTDSGVINVIYGSASGLSATIAPDQYLHQDTPSIEGVSESGDQFGASLAARDFNNDGSLDAAIGVPGEDTGAVTDNGSLNVIYGSSPGGLSATITPDQSFDQNGIGAGSVAENDDRFGTALATGDFNHDGYSDAIVGVPQEDSFNGAINVIYGSAGGLSTAVTPGQYIHQDTLNVEGVAEGGDRFGASLAAGDFDDDGSWDAAIGVWGEDATTLDDGGAAVIYGSAASGLSATATPDQYLGQDSPDIEGAAGIMESFGFSVAA